jgi:hypothetical protein
MNPRKAFEEALKKAGPDRDLYDELSEAGIPLDNHESDLYVLLTPESREILKRHRAHFTTFRSNVDRKLWADVPFSFSPYWRKRQAG